MGTPAQSVRVLVDTGSSDLWFNTLSSALCGSGNSACAASGTYNANSSTTYHYVDSDFSIVYSDESSAAGDYATDTFRLGETTVSALQFGIGYSSKSTENILGIGYEANEAAAQSRPYQNLPAKLVADGAIGATAYSLWLNDLEANTGSLLFGAVDRARYEGELVTLPVQPIDGRYSEFLITLTGLEFDTSVVADNLSLPVLLDSGTSITYLPDDITETIFSSVNAVYRYEQGAAYVPCSLKDRDTNFTFHFSYPASIVISINEMVLGTSSDNTACLFGISPSGNSTSILGDTFLRSAYVVYDLDNNEISLAQTRFNVNTSNIAEISSGSAGVPNATPAASPVAASSEAANEGPAGKVVNSASGLLEANSNWILLIIGLALVLGA